MVEYTRPSWDEYFAKIVEDVSKRSTCFKRQIGALIVNPSREIVATGYNGPVRGAPHCWDVGCVKDEMGYKSGEGHEWCVAVHAEQNALIQAGKSARGCTLYLNAFPCKICARMIVNSGIKKVVISGEYTDKDGLVILENAGVEVVHVMLGK
ncbi:MAG TPA: cytidine deaminase [Candidatus Altiarchaeales archaeon]|nr:cytidine deaminase [Candidatus Altiarchaeales archaeon]